MRAPRREVRATARRSARRLAIAAACILSAAPAVAQEPAVGRLNHAGQRTRMHCTATLVAPDRALTAAHCVQGRSAPDMHVLPGYDRAAFAEDLRPAASWRAPPPRDIALLCLARRAATPPLRIAAAGPRPGESLVVIGYGAPRAQVQNRLRCTVAALGPPGAFSLDCPLAPGASGAPVLRDGPAGLEIVGVVSATSTAASRAWTVTAQDSPAGCD